MGLDVTVLARELLAIESEVHHSNAAVSAHLESVMRGLGFEVERLAYDSDGMEKVSLVGKLGAGEGGLGFFGHSDTVPGGDGWLPYRPEIRDGRLYGRGSSDMKGAVAGMLAAVARVDAARLRRPVFVGVTADEENGHVGARFVIQTSRLLRNAWPAYCVVGEPTELTPVYAHKGAHRITVTARGIAAHTSTDRGVSANFLMAPFLAEMAELQKVFQTEERFMSREFSPATNGFNMVLDDGGCRPNVTAAKTVCTLSLRSMPDANAEEAVQLILDKAKAYGFEVETRAIAAFYTSPDAEVVRVACQVTGVDRAVTVPFGTEAEAYQSYTEPVVLGPGNIAQAHTKGEWIEVEQLIRAVDIYERMIEALCM
ncbi:MAG: M20/M25/M40 family metallo-hydrolase [candidate division NC10 bacterium]|nr:M20/M25/M40 family metallo-hydrolase [candidate division NC10 bacterium]